MRSYGETPLFHGVRLDHFSKYKGQTFGTYLDFVGEHWIVFLRARWETVELASVSLVREVECRVES